MPMDMLKNKDWQAREMSIDPAYDVQVATADGDYEQEEDTVDTKVLYQRFQEKVDKNLIQATRKADLRGNQGG